MLQLQQFIDLPCFRPGAYRSVARGQGKVAESSVRLGCGIRAIVLSAVNFDGVGLAGGHWARRDLEIIAMRDLMESEMPVARYIDRHLIKSVRLLQV